MKSPKSLRSRTVAPTVELNTFTSVLESPLLLSASKEEDSWAASKTATLLSVEKSAVFWIVRSVPTETSSFTVPLHPGEEAPSQCRLIVTKSPQIATSYHGDFKKQVDSSR